MLPRLSIATAAALSAFAGNSVLCRLALRGGHIDPASFTALRLVSGALMLALLGGVRVTALRRRLTWSSGAALLLYAAPFSFAYVELDTGTGALLLFGSVQITMIGWALLRGERPRTGFWLGMPVALGGLVGLTLRSVSTPSFGGALLMICAGIAWGVYSLLGRATRTPPLEATANSFLVASPLALALLGAVQLRGGGLHVSSLGALLACASGAVTSGLGYSVWYYALRSLPASRAAMLQLLVPLLAASAGVLWLNEVVSVRLVVSGAAILAGVALERGWGGRSAAPSKPTDAGGR